MQQVALASDRFVCHEVQQQVTSVGQSGGEVAGLLVQKNNSNCTGVAEHALVLGPSGHVQSNPIEPA